MPLSYELLDPEGLVAAFRESSPMRTRAELYKTLLGILARPRLSGDAYEVLDLGSVLVARSSAERSSLVYAVDDRRRLVLVLGLAHESPNGDSAEA